MMSTVKSLAVAIVAIAATAGVTVAGHTPVAPCTYVTELGHAAILSHAYGGDFAADGLNFTNGTITAVRVEDFGGASADQCWAGELLSARALARFGGFEQTLGLFGGSAGGACEDLFTISGTGFNVGGAIGGLDVSGDAFRFARGGGGELFSSLDSENTAGHDHLVTYRLAGPAGEDRYVLFFEDASAVQDSDWDFNDMVVEITGASPHAIPLPPAVWSGLAVLLTGGLWNARARVRAWLR
jgi:hypothetical protein